MKKVFDLTIAVTAHDEGLLAHKTMLSVMAGIEKIKEAGYTYEIVVHIDKGDRDTINYFSRYEKDKDIRIFENSFGDTGSSRNFVVSKARGNYVAFLDGDDLMSDNWFVKAVDLLKQAEVDVIVHPEAVLTFGFGQKVNVLSIQKPSYTVEKDTVILLGENRWCSVAAAKKEVFQNNPYSKLGLGYGHEDYVFDVETVYSGVKHEIAKGTVLFYRRSENSRLSTSNQNHVTIPYMKLFDFDKVKDLDEIPIEDFDEKLKNRGYRMYKKIRGNDFLNFFITPVAKMTLRTINGGLSNKKKIPDFVIEEWIKINKIETQLYPHEWLVKKVQLYEAERQVTVGNAYLKIAQSVTAKPDYVFIVPWVVRGGADKVMFNYMKALHEIHPEWHFAVVTTLDKPNVWAGRMPEYADLIEFGNIAKWLSLEQQENLFTRMIVQLECNRLHIINSEYGYEWAIHHKELLKGRYKLNASLFCGEFVPGSNLKGFFTYSDPYLIELDSIINKIFTDNESVVKQTVAKDGIAAEKFVVHYQPVERLDYVKKKDFGDEKFHILWASRVADTKLPDVLARIGRSLDPDEYVVDAYGERSPEIRSDLFADAPAIVYHGAYDGFESLPLERFDLFLYTSLSDGIPNVLLEAISAGLPVVASNDGGVSEVIKNEDTGFLIDDPNDADAYVGAIEAARSGQEKISKYASAASELIKKQHSWSGFVEKVRRDI